MLRGAADEVLAVLKNKDLRDPERQRECGQLLGSCDDEMFARLVALGKRITDYVSEAEVGQKGGGEAVSRIGGNSSGSGSSTVT